MIKKFILALYILYLPFQLKLMKISVFNVVDIFLILLTFILIFGRARNFTKPQFESALWLFLIIWIVSFIHTMFYPSGIWKYTVAVGFKRLITLVLGYFVFSRRISTIRELKFLFYVFLITLILVGAYTWYNGMLAGPHFADFKRSSGPFGEGSRGADVVGGFLAIFIPFLLSYSIFAKKKLIKISSLLGVGVCSMGLFATYSRGSILALAISSIAVVLISFPRLLKTSKLTAAIILIGFIGLCLTWQHWVPQSIIDRIQGTTVEEKSYTGELVLDESSQGRMDKWKAGLEVFRMNPLFGVGFNISEYVIKTDAHNSFIQIAAEMGIFGFVAFLLFIFSIFMRAKSLLKTEFDWLGIGFIGCIISFIFVNMFYSNFFRDTVVGTFWVLLGMLVSAKRLSSESQMKPKVMEA